MGQHGPFKTWGDDLWSKLDDLEDSDWWQDSPDEQQEFEKRVRDGLRQPAVLATEPRVAETNALNVSLQMSASHGHDATPGHNMSGPSRSLPAPQAQQSTNEPATPKGRSPAKGPSFNTPVVDTPPVPKSLPRPQLPAVASGSTPAISTRPPTFLDTPDNVPTPAQTPSDLSVGRGRRDDPASPALLGDDSELKKGAYTKITNQFNTFHMKIQAAANRAGQEATRGGRGRGRGRARVIGLKTTRSTPRPEVFKGMRFCMPPEGPQCGTKHESRWNKIVEYGGSVVIQPDTAVTHVIWDQGSSASGLAKKLGLQTLSDLPEGTVCVKWSWVVQCQLTGQVLDVTPFLTFPPTTLSKQPSGKGVRSRMSDITQQLTGSTKGGKRKYDSSDTETESSEPLSRHIKSHRPYHSTMNVTNSAPKKTYPTSTSAVPVVPQPRTQNNIAPRSDEAPLATNHQVALGPGWAQPPVGEADGLDAMITGVIAGRKEEDIEDSEAEDEVDEMSRYQGNPNPRADKFKCGQPSAGRKEGPNEALAKEFDRLHHIYKATPGKNEFAILQYSRVAGVIRRHPEEIKSGSQIRHLRFVGDSMAKRIDEILTGAKGRLYFEDTDQARTIAKFQDVYGVGSRCAHDLYSRGARSIEDLRTKDFGLTAGQLIGVELYDDLCARIPREECRQLFEIVRDQTLSFDDKVFVEIMGSYRRGEANSGDIDILITRDPSDGKTHQGLIGKVVKALTDRKFITHALGEPNDWRDLECKWMGVCRLPGGVHRRIDILSIPWEQKGAALLYFTGNAIFNRSMRLYARKNGYSLNQRGLYRNVIRNRQSEKVTEGEIVASRTEEEIFDVLKIRWRPPHLRRP